MSHQHINKIVSYVSSEIVYNVLFIVTYGFIPSTGGKGDILGIIVSYLCEYYCGFALKNRRGSRISFRGGGGAQKIMCTHHEREARSPLRPGSRARLRALEALGGFWCSLKLFEPYFSAFWYKMGGGGGNIVDQILGRRAPVSPPINTPLKKKGL